MDEWVAEIEFERHSAAKRLLKAALINPMANYLPAGLLRAMLRFGESELAAANWSDPGGWRSMVISYNGSPKQIADKLMVEGGTIPMALRNRRRLGSRVLARLIDSAASNPAHVLCLGAGPGHIIMDAMSQAKSDAVATLVDLESEAFEYGREQAERLGLAEKVRYIESDARHVKRFLDRPPDMVKMLGICEYLDDHHIVDIATAAAEVMPPGATIVFNSLSKAHGTDRFFRRVFGLHMIHRSPHELQSLMQQAGFDDFNSIGEPLGVYHVIVGCRNRK
jgi:predicted RNA methylase